MLESSFTLYKLIILYMLDKVSFPLTNNQISEFILDAGYTNYFSFQQAINELSDSNLVTTETIRNTTYYHMTEEGRETLDFFGKEISEDIRLEINTYLKNFKARHLLWPTIIRPPLRNTRFTAR